MQNIFKIFLLLFLFFQTNTSMAAEEIIINWQARIIGVWQGSVLIAPENELTIQFIISKDLDRSYTAILNSPDQDDIRNVKANSVEFTAKHGHDSTGVLKIDVAELNASYNGILKNLQIKGDWTQEGTSFSLNMTPPKDYFEADVTAWTFNSHIIEARFSEAYAFMNEDFKRMNTEKQFVDQSQITRDQFGQFISVYLLSSKYADGMDGVEGEDYVEIVNKILAQKKSKEPLIERILMRNENNEWKVSTFSFISLEEYSHMQAQKAEMQKEVNDAEIK